MKDQQSARSRAQMAPVTARQLKILFHELKILLKMISEDISIRTVSRILT